MEDHDEIFTNNYRTNIMSNIKEKIKHINKTMLMIILGISFLIGYPMLIHFINNNTLFGASTIKYYNAGERSISINEKNEIVFMHRNTGELIVVDSTLTSIANRMLAAKDYVATNLGGYRIK